MAGGGPGRGLRRDRAGRPPGQGQPGGTRHRARVRLPGPPAGFEIAPGVLGYSSRDTYARALAVGDRQHAAGVGAGHGDRDGPGRGHGDGAPVAPSAGGDGRGRRNRDAPQHAAAAAAVLLAFTLVAAAGAAGGPASVARPVADEPRASPAHAVGIADGVALRRRGRPVDLAGVRHAPGRPVGRRGGVHRRDRPRRRARHRPGPDRRRRGARAVPLADAAARAAAGGRADDGAADDQPVRERREELVARRRDRLSGSHLPDQHDPEPDRPGDRGHRGGDDVLRGDRRRAVALACARGSDRAHERLVRGARGARPLHRQRPLPRRSTVAAGRGGRAVRGDSTSPARSPPAGAAGCWRRGSSCRPAPS